MCTEVTMGIWTQTVVRAAFRRWTAGWILEWAIRGPKRDCVFHKISINVCFTKIRSRHDSNTLMSLLRIFMKQTLSKNEFSIPISKWLLQTDLKVKFKTLYASINNLVNLKTNSQFWFDTTTWYFYQFIICQFVT